MGIIFVSSDPASLPESSVRDARRLASAMNVRWAGITPLNDVEGLGPGDVIYAVGDDWRDLVAACKERTGSAEVYPLWMWNEAEKGVVGYYRLIDGDDLDERLEFLGRDKTVTAVFGNCQTGPIVGMVLECKAFMNDHVLVRMPFIQDADRETAEHGFNEKVLRSLRLFITMVVRDDNKFSPKLSTEYIRSRLADGCRTVVIPNCYFTGYFPQATSRKSGHAPVLVKAGDEVPYNDGYIEEAISTGAEPARPTIEETLGNLNRTIKEMVERERDSATSGSRTTSWTTTAEGGYSTRAATPRPKSLQRRSTA